MKKEKNKDTEVVKEEQEKQQTTQETKASDSSEQENELKKLQDELKQVKEQLIAKELKIFSLESQIQKSQEEYVTKVTAKATEAQKIVDSKLKELQVKFENDTKEIKKYAIKKDAQKIIECVSQLELALSSVTNAPETVKNYLMGFKMILDSFNNALEDMNIKVIEIRLGDEFDSTTMECYDQEENSIYKTNQVVEIVSKGYRLHDHVIQFALVKLSK
jgi:molecular chaperone GrpE